jgi:hypothetical protein
MTADLAKSPTPSVRELSPDFIRSILRDEPYRSSLHTPVAVLGAHLSSSLDLSGSVLLNALSLNNSRFDSTANFGGVEVQELSCKHCYFRGGATMNAINVKDSVDLEAARGTDIQLNSARIGLHAILTNGNFRSVLLRDARIEGDLLLVGASTQGVIDGDSAHLTGRALLRFGNFATIKFRNTTIGSVLELSNSIAKKIDLDQIDVGKAVFLLCEKGRCTHARRQFGDIDLREARIGGDLSFNGASGGKIEGYQTDVKGDVSLSEGRFTSATFRSGRIGGTLRISNALFESLDLTATTIDGDLILERRQNTRAPGALILRNASVHAIDDRPWNCSAFGNGCEDPWPTGCYDWVHVRGCVPLDLNGFTYSALGVTSQHPVDMSGRDVAWWKGWLSREPYSPQPYDRLASVLREAGRPEAANELAYESKNREAASPEVSWFRRAWLLSMRIRQQSGP